METLEELTGHVLSSTTESSLGGIELVTDDSSNIYDVVLGGDHAGCVDALEVVVDGQDQEGGDADTNNKYSYSSNSEIDTVQAIVKHDTDVCINGVVLDEESGTEGNVVVLKNDEHLYRGPVVDDNTADSDKLTDSNSSAKMSPPYEHPTMVDDIDEYMDDRNGDNETTSNSVPINFPIKGRILARLRLHGKGHEYFMTKQKLVIGRNSSKGAVDIDIGHSSFISRNHLTIVHEGGEFFLSCGGKNGVFVDDTFQKIGAPRLQLPKSCALRFPSTQIVIIFDAAEQFIEQYSTANPKSMTSYEVSGAPKALKALSVQIPANGRVNELKRPSNTFFSPCPSPTGTMSAVNSCPTSPTSAVVYSRTASSSSHRVIKPKFVSDAVTAKDERIPLFEGDDSKPPYSYAQLIVQAISSSEDKQMTLSGIYGYIARNYSYFKGNERGWQNSIRHNLSLNRYFIKISRSLDEPGKGCFWSIDPVSEPKLVAQAFKRRNKRGIPFFRGTPKTLKTQSAPVSPSPIVLHPAIYTTGTNTSTTPLPNTNTMSTSAPAVVTVATVNSIAEAVTMQLKKSHVLDLSSVRAIQSAPGSPQGYKVVSPASLIATKVLSKGTASVIGTKASGITLLHPVTCITSTGGGHPVVTLTTQQAQALFSTVTSTVAQPAAQVPTVVSSLDYVQPPIAIQSSNQHGPILIQLSSAIQTEGSPVKLARLEQS